MTGEYRGSLSVRTIIRYVCARLRKEAEERAYRFYVTDALQMISHNTAAALITGGGRYISVRFSEIISRKTEAAESGEEVAARVIKAVCGKGGGKA